MQEKPKHPKGLYVLFFTEMWERFGFYTMLAIFAYYMDEYFQMPKEKSGQIYGLFLAFVYFTPILGGLLADRVLGYYKTIVLGAICLGAGYFLLSIPNINFFYLALVVIITGNGFFKPNISTMVGNLYPDGSLLKDRAFNIFYMGINIGALFAPFAAAYLRYNFGWSYAFGAAGVGMLISLVIFSFFKKHVIQADITKESKANAAAAETMSKQEEKDRVVALLIVFGIVILFWMGFHQNGFTLAFWARDCTDLTSLPAFFQKPEIQSAINPIFVVLLTPLLVLLWEFLNRRGKEPSTPAKIGWGMILTAIAFAIMAAGAVKFANVGRVTPSWLISSYFVITLAELCLSPMGLSFCNKVAPYRMRGLMMGGWFGATAVGNYLSGFLGTYWDKMSHRNFFLLLVGASIFAAILLRLALNKLKKATGNL